MDIWAWIWDTTEELRRTGHPRLARLVDDVPSACVNGQHAQLESMVAEGLSLARSIRHPWLELFFRHWNLQSRVLHRCDVSRDALAEAVSLIEFASRPEARDCPQSVCAAQDLANCYALSDGPGYVEERIAVADETLARIDPSWSCFECISSEKLTALMDARRFDEALEFTDAQARAMRRAPSTSFALMRVKALLAVGRLQAALSALNKADLEGGGTTIENEHRLLLTLCEARLGRRAEALERLPDADGLEPEAYLDWVRCVRELGAADGGPNTWRVESQLNRMAETFSRHAALHLEADLHRMGVELALERESSESATRHLEAARTIAERLRAPAHLLGRLDALEARLHALPTAPTPSAETPDALLEALGSDPEQDIAALRPGCERWPEEGGLVVALGHALHALGRDAELETLLEDRYREKPQEAGPLRLLLDHLLAHERHDRIAELADSVTGPVRGRALWVHARSLQARGALDEAALRLEEILELDPEAGVVRQRLALLRSEQGQHAAALEHMERLVRTNEPGEFDWDRMTVATIAGDWTAVRDSAARLGVDLSSEEGPIEEDWGYCRLRIRLADGTATSVLARRTGPVTARIESIARPDEEQHFRDVVVFDAAPLNSAEVEAAKEAGERVPLSEYPSVACIEAGDMRCFEVDGFHPGAETLDRIATRLVEIGAEWHTRSDDTYMLWDDDADDERPGVYAFVTAPRSLASADVHAALLRTTAGASLVLVWPALAREAGDAATLERHLELCERYDIELAGGGEG